MASVIFVKPALETDATWEMVRTSVYLGIWYLASHLKQQGHDVRYLDEVVRNNGLKKSRLYSTRLNDKNEYKYQELDISLEEYRNLKNEYFESNSPKEFVEKYSAFNTSEIIRVIARTGNPIEETLKEIEKIHPDFVFIPLIASANYRSATTLGRAIKENFPKTKVVFGGQHISALWDEFIQENTWVDHVITGDGITVINDLVIGRLNSKVIHGQFQPLEKFPLLDYSIIEDTGYPVDQMYSYPSFGRKSIDFMFSKGCFRSCEFCVAGNQEGNTTTYWDWDLIDEQLKIFTEYGIQEIIVQDDAFIYQTEALEKKLKLLDKYNLHWQISGGFDFETLSPSITEKLINHNQTSKAKLTGIYMPFNPRAWNKGSSATQTMVSKYVKNFECLKKLRLEGNIYVFTSDIIGTPEHTIEIVNHDINVHKEMIKEGYLDAALTLSATMLPGTVWFKNNYKNIINTRDYPGYSLFTTHHRTENIPNPSTIEELIVHRTKELNNLQSTYNWQTAFPNSTWKYTN
ncbi:MAG: cobalamin-dependent protein [Limnospira sp. PMC 1286.21]|uniref:cobalamin-dependent protein n=3 Tax=Sirenicapillariaceae TaxID=2934961 RepID=UPI001448A9ED|nr:MULTISPECIES: cobalamin-dependent protein [Limnospira]QJB29237.1 hypothetical protein HFV01_29695 [Limnospira fusiformis SAG 85.79]MDT9209622.1 cobalamin-dependent protein [Limnospira sp. PMC 1252.20]MDT9214808.1 cobalamin-dependent protein [Limnospira sp. PMC 1256.20]MDT9219997.1 cobalamin-dependent protein [Limnospira sp. PMC 1240.20]MDT9255699.1 cobalamin-dependent protein [Limnospira sp. PMC 1254.20]